MQEGVSSASTAAAILAVLLLLSASSLGTAAPWRAGLQNPGLSCLLTHTGGPDNVVLLWQLSDAESAHFAVHKFGRPRHERASSSSSSYADLKLRQAPHQKENASTRHRADDFEDKGYACTHQPPRPQ